MRFSHLLALAGLASAAPKPKLLAHDDVLLMRGDGMPTIIKEAQYQSLVKRGFLTTKPAGPLAGPGPGPNETWPSPPTSPGFNHTSSPPPSYLNSSTITPTRTSYGQHRQLRRHGCEKSNEVQVINDTTFLDWDVPMSPVITADQSISTISISEGYSIADSLSVSVSFDETLIKDVLKMSMSISFSQTWTTTLTQQFYYVVPAGQYGIVVSNPSTRRVSGNYLSGCTGDWKQDAFSGDSYTNQNWGGLHWVKGIIRLCHSATYPIPNCVGNGSHA